ncbi:AAA family ATPase [Arthrobacter sp. JZ12]|uniref:SMC family ATPase n=1 Tax=Arthrobacter sp. JZ12 TaxID=2654190 RepID=UPI002B47BF8B|nr:SMC family ATPase [Arthrobacter sp. JZ12]WRH25218.1 AAA family ATPase [Arthrobacter sp. JZ12]
MRIHRLEMQAFGPFADRQVIDFDVLSEQGLFLLNGPTGAGKSSVLDAICYALYGAVPGVRQSAKRLRSDHAPDGLAPEVVCEFSAGNRRLEVTRNPSWSRPSKRGSGTTTEQARTMLRERVAGDWVTRSTRNDEAGAELQGLLGMSREQFTRVVMLPQGEFAAFLRSEAPERAELLQRLFATDRFSTLEQLLADHAARTGARLQEAEAEHEALLGRAVEEVQRHGLGRAVQDGDSAASAEETKATEAGSPEPDPGLPDLVMLQDQLAAAVEDGRSTAKDLTAKRRDAAEKLARLEVERRNRLGFRQLLAEAEQNRIQLVQAAELRHRVAHHRHAEILEAPLHARDNATVHAAAARKRLDEAVAAVAAEVTAGAEVPDAVGAERASAADFGPAHEKVVQELAAARAALPLETDLEDVRSSISACVQALENYASESEQCSTARQENQLKLTDLAGESRTAEELAQGMSPLSEQREDILQRLELISQAEAAESALQNLDERQQEHRTLFLEAKQNWLSLLQLRLEQSAAELASKLRHGDACPVCGSNEHPAPASVDALALVSIDDEEQARHEQDAAERRMRESEAARDAAALHAAGLRARCGSSNPEELQNTLDTVQGELAKAEHAAQRLAGLAGRMAAVEARLTELGTRLLELAQLQAEESSRLATLGEQEAALVARLEQARGSYPSVARKVQELNRLEGLLSAVCRAQAQQEQAEQARVQAEAALQERMDGTGFSSPDAVRKALLPSSEVEEAERLIREAENEAHRVERDLQRPENLAAAALEEGSHPLPEESEIAAAAREEKDLASQLERAVLDVGLLEQSVVQLSSYADRVALLEARLRPLREEYAVVKSLSDTARGNGENLYRMSLATYVLAARLEQVAAAATERLLRMTGGRYSLVHSDSKSGNRKSGLGLNVIDGWTGARRDTATLSGGESFMASLALALGLADVVQQESGGLQIETLFVDEGFGSLDEQTLDQVMDSLENLRDGGRVVGLVSHVPELKQRIPAQLLVTKGRTGSTVSCVNQLQVV